MFDYTLGGWLIRSPAALPHLTTISGDLRQPDIVLSRSGALARSFSSASAASLCASRRPDGSWLVTLPAVGDATIRNGDSIEYAVRPDADPADLCALIVGPAFAAVCHQRRMVTLRATVLARGRTGILIVGLPGTGKSATACLLSRRSFVLVSDGMAILGASQDDDIAFAYRTRPVFELWKTAVRSLGIPAERTAPMRRAVEKYAYLPEHAADPPPVRVRVRNVIFLTRHLKTTREVRAILNPDVVANRLQGSRYLQGVACISSENEVRVIRSLAASASAHVISMRDPAHAADLISALVP